MYDTFSQDYDRFVDWEARLSFEMPHIVRLLDGAHARFVLDAACGTGMHALDLERRGFTAAGADVSEGMVQMARTHAVEAGLDVRFETAGFGALERTFGSAHFDALLCLGNSLPHILETTELVNALQDFAACLRPGGLLLLQMRNFQPVLAARKRFMEPQTHHSGDREWVFLRFYDYIPAGPIQFNLVTLKRQAGANWEQSVSSSLLHPWLWEDLQPALEAAGFPQVYSFANLAGDRFEADKNGDLIIVAKLRTNREG